MWVFSYAYDSPVMYTLYPCMEKVLIKFLKKPMN